MHSLLGQVRITHQGYLWADSK